MNSKKAEVLDEALEKFGKMSKEEQDRVWEVAMGLGEVKFE